MVQDPSAGCLENYTYGGYCAYCDYEERESRARLYFHELRTRDITDRFTRYDYRILEEFLGEIAWDFDLAYCTYFPEISYLGY